MKLIVGLGNPGVSYAGTRHNAGRHLVEAIAKSEGLKWTRKKSLRASVVLTRWDAQEIMLARPEVFMNLSGEAVSLLVAQTRLNVSEDLLVVVDDVALPFGKLRLRGKGTDGGHNGLKSISCLLATTAYPRLRVGIAPLKPDKNIPEDRAPYVLEPFDRQEKEALNPVLKRGLAACRLWAVESLAAAMNTVNPNQA